MLAPAGTGEEGTMKQYRLKVMDQHSMTSEITLQAASPEFAQQTAEAMGYTVLEVSEAPPTEQPTDDPLLAELRRLREMVERMEASGLSRYPVQTIGQGVVLGVLIATLFSVIIAFVLDALS
jgi:hypothetical protein